MSKYESTIICSPELPAEKVDELVEKIKKTVDNSGGKVVMFQQLGRKRLAYTIKKHREGTYVYFELNGTGEMISVLEKFYQVNDPIIRYLTIKAEKKKIIPQKAAQPAEATPAPAPAAAPAAQEVKPNEHNQSQAS